METSASLHPTKHFASISPSVKRWLLVIISLGFIARLMVGYVQPAFCDEGYMFCITKAGWSQMMHEIRFDVHPPTLNILLYPLVQWTNSIFLIRLPQIILSILTMLLAFALSRRFVSDSTALLVTACFTFSHDVWLSDAQFRTYGPLTCASTAFILGSLTVFRDGTPYRTYLNCRPRCLWILYTIAALGCSCFHASGVLLLFTAFVFFLIPNPSINSTTKYRVLIMLAFAALPPVIWGLYARLSLPVQLTRDTAVADAASLLYSPVIMLTGLGSQPLLDYFSGTPLTAYLKICLPPFFLITNIIIWVLYIRGLLVLKNPSKTIKPQSNWERFFIFGSFVSPLALLYLANVLKILTYQARYMSPFLAPFLVLAFAGAAAAGRWLISALFLSVNGIVLLCFPNCTWLWNQYWQSTIDFITANQQPGDHIAVHIPSTCYCFTMAYDIDNISYVFSMQGSSNVQIKQNLQPGKLDVLPLNGQMVGPSLVNDYWKDGRVFLIINQGDEYTQQMIEALNEYYAVVNYHRHLALHGWGNVATYLLQRKDVRQTNDNP